MITENCVVFGESSSSTAEDVDRGFFVWNDVTLVGV